MASSLPDFPKFDVNHEPSSLGLEWTNWITRFDNLLVALDITAPPRQKALLLFYAGKDVHDVYNTVKTEGEDYTAAKTTLKTYFEPSKNETFEVYAFRSLTQLEGETTDKYVTRLKEKASRCGFHDVNKEIKHQIVFSCRSRKVRRKALSDDPTLEDLIKYARSMEQTDAQAKVIENTPDDSDINKIGKPGKYSRRYNNNRSDDGEKSREKSIEKSRLDNEKPRVSCFFCGGEYPHHGGRKSCPAYDKKCHKCNRRNHFSKYCPKGRSVNKVNEDMGSSTSDSSDDEYVYSVHFGEINNVSAKVELKLENKRINFQIDSGASVNVINDNMYKSLRSNVKLHKNSVKLFAYGSKKPLPVIGWFYGAIETKNKIDTARFYVVRGMNMNPLLGLETASALGVLKIVNSIADKIEVLPSPLREIVNNHKSRFHGIGKLKDVKVKLSINREITPVANKHRRIPFHLRNKVDAELDRLTAAGVIEPVKDPTGWVSPVVITNKPDGDIRICVDMTEPNKAIERVRHVIPTIDDIRYQVNGATLFSKIDLKNGYHQLELDESSRNITTFSTHRGLARYCRLNFGTSSAAEIFHNEISKRVESINGALSIHDDILIFGRTQSEHDEAVKDVLKMLEQNNLTVNKKCEFNKKSIKFYGLVFSANGVSPDPEKVSALKRAEPPTSKSELRSFLGMVSFNADFIEKFSELTNELRQLTHEKAKWEWNNNHQCAFDKIKEALCEHSMLSYFNPSWETEVVCDGSPFGVSGILVQINPNNGERKIVAYASRSLSDAETRYGQVEREALSVHFACLRFRIYLLGKQFSVATDHKPLVFMFNKPRTQMPYRIERIRMKLQGFNFTVRHMPGLENPSDFISRKPIEMTNSEKKQFAELEKHVHHIMKEGHFDAVSLEEIEIHTRNDEMLKILRESILKGHRNLKDYPKLSQYKKVFTALSVVDGIIMKGHKIVIPTKLRELIIAAGHDGHQGMDKTKMLLRSKYWYPGIDKDIDKFVSNCRGCQSSVNDTSREPLIMGELPSAPWESVVTDYYGPLATGEYLIVTIDEYSRFPIVKIANSTSPKSAIPKYDEIFSEFGVPGRVRSDNGSPYNSKEFSNYAKYLGFHHKPVMPCYPQANGMVEKFNTNLTKVIMTSKVLKTNWKQEMYKFLRNYRSTPHCTTGVAPAEIMFKGRNFRTRLPEISVTLDDQHLRENDRKNKDRIKKYADKKSNVRPCKLVVGDSVLVKKRRKCKSDPYYDPRSYIVTKRKGNMITAERDDHVITRNTSFFKHVNQTDLMTRNQELGEDSDYSDADIMDTNNGSTENMGQNEDAENVENEVPLRRSTRVTGQPVRYPMDVMT